MSYLSRRAPTSATATATSLGNLSKDIEVSSPPGDSISSIAWSPTSNHLAVASWDSKVRIYDIYDEGKSEGKAIFGGEGPILSCHWSQDGQKVIGAGADKVARVLDLASNGAGTQQVAVHDEPIKAVKFFEAPQSNASMIVTGSWDKTIKYWDMRQATPVSTVICRDRVYSIDIVDQLLVTATASQYINIIDLKKPGKVFKTIESPLKHQMRVVKCFHDGGGGFAIGSIEGKTYVQWMNDLHKKERSFSFKCQREPVSATKNTNVYAVNDVSFHPVHGTFSTAGADGTYTFWDKESKMKLKGYPFVGGAISATEYNRDGKIFAYAVSYDWSKGFSTNTPQYPIKIMLHPVADDECQPKVTKPKR